MHSRPDGTADYEVEVRLNRKVIWRGSVNGHVRAAGVEGLLRMIADKVEQDGEPFRG